MRTVRKQFIVFAGLLAVIQLGKSKPIDSVEASVTKLMESSKPDRIGLVDYFKELGLPNLCNLTVIDNSNLKVFEEHYNEPPCLCTVIYKVFKELEPVIKSSSISLTDFESAKKSNIKLNDQSVYDMWKHVSKESLSLKLLMDSLNSTTNWNTVCFNAGTVTKYCQFLNTEVVLLDKTLQMTKETISEALPNKSDPNKIGSLSTQSKINDTTTQKTVLNSNGDDLKEIDKAIDINELTATEGKIDTNFDEMDVPFEIDSNDNLKESDGTIVSAKESQSVNSQKNTFKNRPYSDPEDDSHFLFYFGIMTVLSMVFYLALYNKKKIIALIIEGRRGTNHRKRPNTATYSKVETDDGSNIF